MKSPPLEGGEGPCEILSESVTRAVASLPSLMGLTGGPTAPTASQLASEENVMSTRTGGGERGVSVGAGEGAVDEVVSVLQKDLVPHTNFTHTFLKSILTSIDSNDPVVANAWLETLLDVIDLLPKDVIKDEILSMAVSKGQSQQVSSRLAACKLLGKIATKFEPFLLKTEVVGVVQSLCQDVSGEVRANMCAQLAPVARGLGLDSTKTHILPELVDLCADEETNVRLAGIHTVVHIIPLLDDDTRVGTIVPLVKKICERALKVEDATLPVTTHLLGQLCHGLHDDFTEEQKQWFLNFYCSTAKMGLPDGKKSELPMPDLVAEVRSGDFEAECRQQCAFNLPGMIIFVGGSKIYRTSLHSTFCSLVADPSNHVRATVAASFHQLCTLVGSEVGLLKDGLLQLLRSESLEILTALTPHLPQILTTMAHHNVIMPSMPVNELVEIVGAVKQGEETVSITSNWRLHADTLTKLASLAQCLPQQMIFTDLVPLMIIRMHASRPIPCRVAAARTLLIFLHHLSDSEHREHICQTLVSEFCEGSSCHKRMLFLSVCNIVLELFSKSFFKKHFFQPLLSLHADRVANIRLKVVMILPQMKATLTLPEDKIRLQELETVVGSLLMNEGDRDVSAGISNIITQLDKIEVCHSQTTSLSRGEGDGAEQRSENHGEGNVKEAKSPIGSGLKTADRKSSARSSYRHSSGIGSSHIASYLTERRRSGSHAPKQPPDERTLLRGDGSSNTSEAEPSPWDFEDDDDIDLDDLVDEVLLSPDEDDVSTSSLGKSGSWDSRRDRFHRDGRSASASQVRDKASSRRGRDAAAASIKRELSFQDRGSSSSRHSHSRESSSFLREIREANMSTKDLFWLKTSRPKWRRKVASADTSPEMPRRGPFGRGRDGRGSLSDTEEPDFIVYEHPRRRGLDEDDEQGKTLNTDFSRDTYLAEENLPSSPYGINTWPPQHVRHRHHSANEQEEPSTSYSGGHSSSRNTTTTMASTHYDTLRPVHPTKRNSPSSPHQESVSSCSSLRGPTNQRSRDDGRHDLFGGGRTREGFTHEDGEMGGMRSYPSPHSYHHSAMLPPLSSRSSSGLSHAYSSQSLPSQFSYDFTEDYLTSFIYPEPYSPDPYQAAAAAAAAAAERYAADPYQRELHPSLLRMDPYERDSRMCDIRREYDGGSVYEAAARVGMMGMDSHSCHFLDSAELAPWSSPPAYPIGPLGASWLRHGLPQYPMARIPPCLIPTPYSRPAIRPHHPGGPVSSPPWRLTHHNSLPSMSALDPTTDEFLVDAGIRIDESVMRSRLPTPQASGNGVPRWRPQDRPTSLIPLGLEGRPKMDGGSTDGKTHIPVGTTGSRIRPPTNIGSFSRSLASTSGASTFIRAHSVDTSSGSSRRPGSAGSSASRLRPPSSISSTSRPSRPVSTLATSSPSARVSGVSSRTKSLSHENLRTSPSRLALPASPKESPRASPNSSRASSPHTSSPETEGRSRSLGTSGSRLRQPQVHPPRVTATSRTRPSSCSSSPGGSRCSSPGLDGPMTSSMGSSPRGSRSRGGSASSSPASSRCSSPGGEEGPRYMSRSTPLRSSTPRSSAAGPRRGSASAPNTLSRTSRRPTTSSNSSSSSSISHTPTTPPSPAPSPRTPRSSSSTSSPGTGVRGRGGSRLPIPTSKN